MNGEQTIVNRISHLDGMTDEFIVEYMKMKSQMKNDEDADEEAVVKESVRTAYSFSTLQFYLSVFLLIHNVCNLNTLVAYHRERYIPCVCRFFLIAPATENDTK